jgi:hypothetical protein
MLEAHVKTFPRNVEGFSSVKHNVKTFFTLFT